MGDNPINLGSVKKILVCQLRQLGDVLLTTPAIELLRRRFPEAELHMLTEKKCLPMLQNNPNIDKIWAIDKKELPNIFKELAFYCKVAKQDFDIVVDFQQLPRCRWVVAFSRARIRLTYPAPFYTRFLYNCFSPMEANSYAAQKKVDILKPLGITWNGEAPKLYLTSEEVNLAEAILEAVGLKPEHKLITLDPTHIRKTRLWSSEYYAKFIDMAFERDPSLRFLALYGPGEDKYIVEIIDRLTHKEALLLTPRMLSLREAAACQSKAVMHFGNCSAPRHMATAVGTPTLIILGSTDKNWSLLNQKHKNISLDLPCQPCFKNECTHISCLNNLMPEVVLEEFFKMLNGLEQENS